MYKKLLASLMVFVLVASVPLYAGASLSIPRNRLVPESYVYNYRGSNFTYPTPAPLPYRFSHSVSAQDIGVETLMHIAEIEYHDGQFVIANGPQLVVTDDNFVATKIIDGVYVDGEWEDFTPLSGIFITLSGEVYIAEPGAGRVLHFDENFELVRVIGRPYGIPLDEDATYRPTRVAVDGHGRIYIIADGVFEGIVELNPDGTFLRYFGVVDVRPSAAQLFLRRFQTTQQRIRTQLLLPTNFSNLTVCETGFVYATLSDPGTTVAAKKLNARGENIMRRPSADHFVGDMVFNTFGIDTPLGPSVISIITVTNFGVYYVFDSNRNRVFAYDIDGHMLFAFGGTGTREGTTAAVMGMTTAGNRLVFADRGNRSIEVFERTEYGNLLLSASRYQFRHDYMNAARYWQEVLRFNPFFQYAYLGVGIALHRQGYYEEAMVYFQRGQDAGFFSMSYAQVRAQFMYRHFNTFMSVLTVLLGLYIAYKIYKRVRYGQRSAVA